jgi:hypothetical protein
MRDIGLSADAKQTAATVMPAHNNEVLPLQSIIAATCLPATGATITGLAKPSGWGILIPGL